MDKKKISIGSSVLWLAFALGACVHSPRYEYFPAPTAKSTEGPSVKGAIFPIEKGSSHGQIRLFSPGVVTVRSEDKKVERPAILVRMAVSNFGQDTWKINARTQELGFGDGKMYAAVSVNTDRCRPPAMQVTAGETQVLDFYFSAIGHEKEDHLPGYDFKWALETSQGSVGDTVAFLRSEPHREPNGDPNMPAQQFYGESPWGPNWWYSPYNWPLMPDGAVPYWGP